MQCKDISKPRRLVSFLAYYPPQALPEILARCARDRYSRGVLYMFVIPRKVSLIPIADITRSRNSVELIRVDYQLCIYPQTSKRLIHLLSTLHRHVEVALATEEQGRCLDTIGVQERIRDLYISLPGLRVPGRPNFVVVLDNVLIGSVERDRKCRTCSTGCSLKARVARNHVVSQYPTVAPAANAQFFRIGNSHSDHVIDAGL